MSDNYENRPENFFDPGSSDNDMCDFVSVDRILRDDYLKYSMSVIVGRALPDARDGLKPVQRRVLYAMNELSNDWNRPYKKSARVVGDVIGKYHPHGDSSVYDALVRMAQPFSLRYTLVDGQGNFGSIDGDSPAAMRYTEVRLTKLSSVILSDLDSDTVDFAPNYDNSEIAPIVLPTRVPNLLLNGSSGIAVGMATNIPPHNIGEVMRAVLALINDSDIEIDELMKFIIAPDFPTGGIICGRSGIQQAYHTGRGKIYVRAKCRIENADTKPVIIVEEIPYMVNKARMLEKIALLIREKKITGISALRDESDREGMRVVIECSRGENAEVILNKLYIMTQLQTVFGVNMVALNGQQPKCMNLKEMLVCFLEHRKDVVRRRTQFKLNKAKARGHLLEGLAVAVCNVDEMVLLIKSSANVESARQALMSKKWSLDSFVLPLAEVYKDVGAMEDWYGLSDDDHYMLSEKQAQSILDLRLQKLTGLERDKISFDYTETIKHIQELLEILRNNDKLMNIIRQETEEIIAQYSDERRTEVANISLDQDDLDFIAEETIVVTLSNVGYIKAQSVDQYEAQRRGGRGKISAAIKDEDAVKYIAIASNHDTLLCFSSKGKLYWLKAHHLPQALRQSRGRPINNFLQLDDDEHINALLPVREYLDDVFVVMATSNGVIKKVCLSEFSRPRQGGIIAIALDEGDSLIAINLMKDSQDVLLFSTEGKVVRFNGEEVRSVGRSARGVMGMRCGHDHKIVAMVIAAEASEGCILTVTEGGYGKRTELGEYRKVARKSRGVIAMKTDEKTRKVIDAKWIKNDDEIVLISDAGLLVRIRVDEITTLSRNTKGVRLINLKPLDKVVDMAVIPGELIDVLEDEQSED